MSRFKSRVPAKALRPQANLEYPIACDSVPQSSHYVRMTLRLSLIRHA